MSSLHFVVHPLPGTEDQLNDSLKEVSEKLNRFGVVTPVALNNLKIPVKKIVIGPTHFALLLDDGRVCRVAFSIISDRLDLTKSDPTKSSSGGNGGSGTSGNKVGSTGGRGAAASSSSGEQQLQRSRAHIVRTNASLRGAPGVIMGAGGVGGEAIPIVPAPYVPEELVELLKFDGRWQDGARRRA